jgi:hypothetical protein
LVSVRGHWPKANQHERSDPEIEDRYAHALSLRDMPEYRHHGQVARATEGEIAGFWRT